MRRAVARLLSGTAAGLVAEVLLVVTVLVGNVIQHSGGPGELRLWCEDRCVWIEVHDLSRTFPRLQRADPLRPGGRGLLLVAALAETWGSRPTPTGKLVWARLESSADGGRDRTAVIGSAS
jgi:hypothetical protein